MLIQLNVMLHYTKKTVCLVMLYTRRTSLGRDVLVLRYISMLSVDATLTGTSLNGVAQKQFVYAS